MTFYVVLDVENAYQSIPNSPTFAPIQPVSTPLFFPAPQTKGKNGGHSIILHTSPHQAILIPNDRLILHRSLLARTSRKTLNHGIPLGRNEIRNGITRWSHQTVFCGSGRSRRRRRWGRRTDTVESGFQDVVTPALH